MRALKVEDIRSFTRALFMQDCFDGFLLGEAEFSTFCSFSVDGRVERSWFTDEELEKEQIEAYVRWGRVRELCFQLIRGRKTPSSFRITLRLAPGERERFLREAGYAVDAEQIGSFLLNLRFEKGELSCVSLASLNCFPPERSLEEAWDQWAQRFFRGYELAVSVL